MPEASEETFVNNFLKETTNYPRRPTDLEEHEFAVLQTTVRSALI